MTEKEKSTLVYMQEMFKDKVDEDVIKLVLTESQYDVEKTVMQLLTLSESMNSKNSVGMSSSSRKFDDIDPVDIPLPDMNQYLHPDTKDFTENQLGSSISLPNSQFPVPKPKRNPVSGTARPMFPNYDPIPPRNPSQVEPRKVSDRFYEDELYVSDDDINEQLDSVSRIDRSGKNESVDDKSIGKVQQNRSKNSLRNKNSENQSFNDNNPVNIHNSKRTNSPHPFELQFNLPPNRYFVNQARYFSNLTSTPRSHQFVQTRGNTPSGQYQRPTQHQRYPTPRYPTPAPRHFNPTTTHPATVETDLRAFNNPLSAKSRTNSAKMRNYPAQATSVAVANKEEPITSSQANHPEEGTTVATSSRRYNNATSVLSAPTSEGPNHPSPANGINGPNDPIPTTIGHGRKGTNSARPTHGIKEPNFPTTSTVKYSSKVSNHSLRAAMPETSPIHRPHLHPRASLASGNKGHRQATPANATKVSNHSHPPNSKNNGKESNDVVRGNNSHQSFRQAKPTLPEVKSLTLLRGLPGSGKSTFARQLAAKGGMIISTDDYFEKGNKYCFNPVDLTAAHEWNQGRAKAFMEAGLSPLIVDNTNTEAWEMRPYVLIGLKCGYKIDIKEPDTWWKWNIKELERRNTHGVSLQSLERMLERYEKNVTVERIVNSPSTPVITPKPEDGEELGHALKRSKPSNTEEQHSRMESKSVSKQAQGKPPRGQTKRTATTKKTIALSANFSGVHNSMGLLGDSDGTKENNRQDNKHTDQRLNNTTGKPSDSAQEFADIHENKELDTESNCDALVLNEQTTTGINHVCARETSSNESNSNLQEIFKNSESKFVNPRHTRGDEMDLNEGNDNSKNKHSFGGDKLSGDVSASDGQVEIKDTINSLFNNPDPTVKEEDPGGDHQTSTDTEGYERMAMIEPGLLESKNERVMETQVISDQEECEVTTRIEQDTDIYHSDSADEESDSDSINKQDEAIITSCPANQPSLPSTRNNENIAFSSAEQNTAEAKKISFEMFLPDTDLQSTIRVGHEVLFFDRKEERGITSSENNNTGNLESGTDFDSLLSISNTQSNPSSSVLDIPTKTVATTSSGVQERDQSDALIQTSSPDLVVNPNSEVLSHTGLNVPKRDAKHCHSESNEGDSGIDSGASRNGTGIVRRNQEHPCKNSPIATDVRNALGSSKTELNQTDYGKSSDTYAADAPVPNTRKENFQDVDFDLESGVSGQSRVSGFPSTGKEDALDPINFLKDCFPNSEIDILKSFFNSCDEDLVKTVECLLECNLDDYNDTQHEQSTMNNFDNSLLRSTSAENHIQDTSGNLKTPEENRNSSFNMKLESPISSSSTPRKFQEISVDSLQLTLDPALALQLLEMFGAFSGVSGKDPLSESTRCIKIDKDFAKTLYTKWRKTVQATNKGKKTEVFKKSSPDGNMRRKYKAQSRQFYLPEDVPVKPEKPVAPQPEPVSLKEIMDEQLAIHVSQSDQEIEKRFLEQQLDLSTKLKRSRLHGMFPNIDKVSLNEIFQANNYDLDTTTRQVQSSCGIPLTQTPTALIQDQSFTINHSSNKKQANSTSQSSSEYQSEVDGNFQSFHDPSYQDYRAEAQTHYELRNECIKKAALAYSKKQGELAKVYADQARSHGEKNKEANRRAAEKILESRNNDLMHTNTLDLHELHVNEAIEVLENVLEERRNERRSPNKRSLSYVEVITGRGNRSRDGKPRIKPAVMDYLKRKGYRYEELNSGLYRVFLN
ncbi:uncharacterized protein LOC114524483 isoform X2 [Dendronephthya gigantea]|uniref:uncharacterized protein LOC114524483 isoform X2 n=1 Tax=Dendronephthya gigantea TaxID=151771 RepID=UPI00106C3FD3|nr:uncharacterized protein LOC114524483 isoform X2 [Dendronephthya gigantea]